ncbi:hypothetical protein PTUN_a2395 [Pseudoalteromonas tunicata]|nr:hypothetical protein PTUN_a2395 [Pseudoalteromonas tunicata]
MFAVICPVGLKLDLQNAAELRSTWLAGLHLRPSMQTLKSSF